MKLLALGTTALFCISQTGGATIARDRILWWFKDSVRHPPLSVTAIVEPVAASKESYEKFVEHLALRDSREQRDHAPSFTYPNPSENVPGRGVVHIGGRIGKCGSYPAVFIRLDDPEWILKYTVDCHTKNQALNYYLQDIAAKIGVGLPVAYLSPPTFMENEKLEKLFCRTCPLEHGANVRYQLERRRGSSLAEPKHSPLNAAAAIYTAKHVLEMVHTLHRAGIVHRNLKPNNIVYEHSEEGSESKLRFDDFTSADIVAQDTPSASVDDETSLAKRDDVLNAIYLLEFLLGMKPSTTQTDVLFKSMPYLKAESKRKSRDCLIRLMRKIHDLPARPHKLPYEAFSEYLKRAWDALLSSNANSSGC